MLSTQARDPGLRDLATLRLAGLKADQGQLREAIDIARRSDSRGELFEHRGRLLEIWQRRAQNEKNSLMRVMRIFICLLVGIVQFAQICNLVGQDLSALVVNVSDMGDGSISQARLEAQRQARSGGLPFRSFRRGQIRNFVGQYTPPELPEDKKDRFIYGLALFSDDGCNVTLKGSSVHARFGRGQHLPNLGQSFHVLPVALSPGETVDITIDYRNTIYAVLPGQPPDIDGLTLFLYLIPVAIAVDASRDGDIVFEGDSRDITSTDKPFRFWINDDHDGISK